MRSMLLIYMDPELAPQTPEEREAAMGQWWIYTEELQSAGVHLAGDALQPTATATTVRVRNCVRVAGTFAASLDHRTGDLVVKLPADRVAAMIDAGDGQELAPAGRPFREWVAIPDDEGRWHPLLAEAIAFAAGTPSGLSG